jgi:hypothetical protein
LVPLGRGRCLAEGFERCGGGASGDLGQSHQFGDGGKLAVSGGVSGRGGVCAAASGCGVSRWGGPYDRKARGDLRVFNWLCNRRRVVHRVTIGLYIGWSCGEQDVGVVRIRQWS